MQTVNLVKAALKETAPGLHRKLVQSGGLNEYVQTLAEEISSRVVTLTQAQRAREKWDRLGPMECAARMKMADALHLEMVLAEALEFPRDETSPSRLDGTMPSAPMT